MLNICKKIEFLISLGNVAYTLLFIYLWKNIIQRLTWLLYVNYKVRWIISYGLCSKFHTLFSSVGILI